MTTQPRSRFSNPDLLAGAIAPTIVIFALPSLASSVLQSASGSLNAIWVGRFIGEVALAATANGNILMFLLIAFVFGFGMASTIYIGQAFGRGDEDGARKIVGTALGAFVPSAIVVAAAGWLLSPSLLTLLGTPPEAYELALAYLRVIFISMPCMLTITLLTMALRGAGNSVVPLIFTAVVVVIDAGLNPFLIAGLGPFPELGIEGAALATVIANVVGLVTMVWWIYRADLPLRLRGPELMYLKPDAALLKLILTKGLPIGLQMIVLSSAALSILSLVNAQGAITTAAYNVAQQLWTYVQMPAMALSAAVSAMVAQNIGAKQWDRVSATALTGIALNVLLTGALIVTLLFAAEPAISLFLGADSLGLVEAERIIQLATWGFIPFGVALVLFGTVRANGEVWGPLLALVIGMYPVRIGFALTFESSLGADAIWLSFPASMVAIFVMSIGLYRYSNWRSGSLLPFCIHECRQHVGTNAEPVGNLKPSY